MGDQCLPEMINKGAMVMIDRSDDLIEPQSNNDRIKSRNSRDLSVSEKVEIHFCEDEQIRRVFRQHDPEQIQPDIVACEGIDGEEEMLGNPPINHPLQK